jgi:hypothetical protein
VNIQQLEYILAVDQFKSFSKAADYCHVTQATLSAMVKKLEEQLDIVIFDRKANPIAGNFDSCPTGRWPCECFARCIEIDST